MDKKFLTAFILPKEWEVIGYKLKPYSTRVHINLSAVNSPFVTNGVPTPMDTIKFLKFCSSDCDSIIDIPKTTFFDTIAYLRLASDLKFFSYTVRCIINYIKEYTTGPSYRIVSKHEKSDVVIDKTSMPELLMMISICMSKLGMSEKEAMNSPLAKLSWYVATVALMEGADVRLLSDDEVKAAVESERLKKFEKEQAEKLRLAMVNGKIPTKKIKIRGKDV